MEAYVSDDGRLLCVPEDWTDRDRGKVFSIYRWEEHMAPDCWRWADSIENRGQGAYQALMRWIASQ